MTVMINILKKEWNQRMNESTTDGFANKIFEKVLRLYLVLLKKWKKASDKVNDIMSSIRMIKDPEGLCLLVYILKGLLLIGVVIVHDLSVKRLNVWSMLGLLDISGLRRDEASCVIQNTWEDI